VSNALSELVETAYLKHSKTVPVNIEQMIRDSGLELDKKASLAPDIAGEIRKTESGIYKISTNKNDHYYRRRFTMAHELGHYYFHRSLIGDGVDDNVKYRSTRSGAFYNTHIDQKHETEANLFAALVLMPDEKLKEKAEARGGKFANEDVRELAIEFQVSPEAMRIKLSNLGLLP